MCWARSSFATNTTTLVFTKHSADRLCNAASRCFARRSRLTLGSSPYSSISSPRSVQLLDTRPFCLVSIAKPSIIQLAITGFSILWAITVPTLFLHATTRRFNAEQQRRDQQHNRQSWRTAGALAAVAAFRNFQDPETPLQTAMPRYLTSHRIVAKRHKYRTPHHDHRFLRARRRHGWPPEPRSTNLQAIAYATSMSSHGSTTSGSRRGNEITTSSMAPS